MKKLTLFALLLIISASAFAQESDNIIVAKKYNAGFVMGLNTNLLLPFGYLSGAFAAGFGGGATAKYIIDGKVGVGVLFNYQLLAARNPAINITNTVMNFGGSLEYYLNKPGKITPYFGLDVAYYSFLSHFGSGGGATTTTFSVDNPFFSGLGLAPNIGFAIQINKYVDSNINFKYNHIFSSGYASQIVTISTGLIFHITQE